MAKAAASAPADRVALYERLVATNPQVERKGATMPYTSLNGNMFSFLMKSGRVGLRLPEAERERSSKSTRRNSSSSTASFRRSTSKCPTHSWRRRRN